MNSFRADLHVHTVLSPCGDLEMSPAAIVETAARRGIDILGITDHNSTKHGPLVNKLAQKKGIFVLCGAEVTTREEVHCLAFFENFEILGAFQQYLDSHLPYIKNDPRYFGYQVVLDEEEMIVEEEERLLISGLDQGLDQVEEEVHRLGGLFIPAHIDRPKYSLTSQLGFVPPGLKADALEVSRFTTPEKIAEQFPWIASYTFIRSSDAHHPDAIGSGITIFEMEHRSFDEIRKALHRTDNRSTRIEKH
jgi:3',5'-nucleoside bisphosphate phosphatase